MNYYEIQFPNMVTITVKSNLSLSEVSQVLSKSSGVLSFEENMIYNPKSFVCVNRVDSDLARRRARNFEQIIV